MRKRIESCLFIAMCIGMALSVQAEKKPAKVPYVFPDAMGPAVREAFTKECDKGQALYQLACASCHNTIENGRTIIPDWTSTQLVGYELRVLNPRHETGIPEEQVTAEELGYIMTFLTYKKKNDPVGK